MPSNPYIYAHTYKANWAEEYRNLQRDLYAHFDTNDIEKNWVIRVSTDQINQPITLSISENFAKRGEKLYLIDNATGNAVDLTKQDMVFSTTVPGMRTFTLYWGNHLPVIKSPSLNNRYLSAGDSVIFTWTTNNRHLVKDFELYLDNGVKKVILAENLSYTTETYS